MDNNENASGSRAATLLATGEVVTPEQFYQDSDGSNWGRRSTKRRRRRCKPAVRCPLGSGCIRSPDT